MRTVIHKFKNKRGEVVDVQLEVRSAAEYIQHADQPKTEEPQKPAVKPSFYKAPDAHI
jgi:hypothetical protein